MAIPIDIKTGGIKEQGINIGIDLGTTFSLAAWVDSDRNVRMIDTGKVLVPSVIHFLSDGEPIVGDEAQDRLISHPERTIYSVKRLMGKSYEEIQNLSSLLDFQVQEKDEDALVRIKMDDRYFTPIELSSIILKTIRKRSEKVLGRQVTGAVITVPAYFNDTQRQATRDAGKLAGLEVLRIINEPTAASLSYGLNEASEEEQIIAVYDFGGGTFDISILRIEKGIFQVLSTSGDTHLGGDDIDEKILNYWTSLHDIDPDRRETQKLRLMSEEAKKVLSSKEKFHTAWNDFKLVLTRKKFNELIHPIVGRTIDICKIALEDADIKSQPDQVVMVGGSTRIPLIKERVKEFFGVSALRDEQDPDLIVAKGAAIQADILSGNRKDILLLDITPLSLGIETAGGLMDVIIPRNTPIPARLAREYTTGVDGQVNLKISIYQGEREMVGNNRKLGEFILKGIPPLPAGIPKIQIVFSIDTNGILSVEATEQRTGISQSVEVNPQYGISEEEMALMLKESLNYAEEDIKKKAVVEAKTEGRQLLRSSDKFIEQNKDWITADDLSSIKKKREGLRQVLESEDKDVIRSKIDELEEFTKPLAQKAMEKVLSEHLKDKEV